MHKNRHTRAQKGKIKSNTGPGARTVQHNYLAGLGYELLFSLHEVHTHRVFRYILIHCITLISLFLNPKTLCKNTVFKEIILEMNKCSVLEMGTPKLGHKREPDNPL